MTNRVTGGRTAAALVALPVRRSRRGLRTVFQIFDRRTHRLTTRRLDHDCEAPEDRCCPCWNAPALRGRHLQWFHELRLHEHACGGRSPRPDPRELLDLTRERYLVTRRQATAWRRRLRPHSDRSEEPQRALRRRACFCVGLAAAASGRSPGAGRLGDVDEQPVRDIVMRR
jgi:hypothetical protein